MGLGLVEEDGLFLVNAGQVEQIRTGPQTQSAVRVSGQNIVGIHDHQRVGQKEFGKIRSVLYEKLWVDGGVSHGGKQMVTETLRQRPALT
jgi:hypothetical protein